MNDTTSSRPSDRHSPVPSGAVVRCDLAAEAAALRSEAAWREAGHNAKTLLRRPDLRVVLVVLKAGARLHEHRTDHPIIVQTVIGHVELHLPDQRVELPASGMLALDASIPHDVVAREDSAILVSIRWTGKDASAWL